MTAPHPTDRTLASLIDGRLATDDATDIRQHLSGCARCQLRIGAAGEGLRLSTLPAWELVGTPPPPADGDRLAEAGDVWRLSWDETVIVAVVIAVDPDRIAVEPMVETADADEWCALLPAEVTGGLGELAVSVAMETTVPWSVLDARIGRLASNEPLESLRRVYRRRRGAATTSRRGDAVHSSLDERLPGLERVGEDLTDLANASWAPVTTGPSDVSFDFDQLADAGLPVNRALAITRGASVTDTEAELIEAATGTRPAAAAVPIALRREIDQPHRKARIQRRARISRQSESVVRLELARAAEPQGAAARGTQGAPPDYVTILDRLLDA